MDVAAAAGLREQQGDARLLAHLNVFGRATAEPAGAPSQRLEQVLGRELAGKLLFALGGRSCVAAQEAAA